MKLSISSFGGIAPKQNPRYLQDTQAQVAVDCSVNTGPLRALSDPLAIGVSAALNSQTIYRFGQNNPDTALWMTWPGDIDVARSPVHNDDTERTYFTGDGAPKVTDSTMAPSSRPLGVPLPTTAPTVAEVEYEPELKSAEIYLDESMIDKIDLVEGFYVTGSVTNELAVRKRVFPEDRTPAAVKAQLDLLAPEVLVTELYGNGVKITTQEAFFGPDFGIAVHISGPFDNTYEAFGTDEYEEESYDAAPDPSVQGLVLTQTDLNKMVNSTPYWDGADEFYLNICMLPWLRFKRTADEDWTYLVVGGGAYNALLGVYMPYYASDGGCSPHNSITEVANTLNGAGLDTSISGDELTILGATNLEYRDGSGLYAHIENSTTYAGRFGLQVWISAGTGSGVGTTVVEATGACLTLPLSDVNASAPFGFYLSVDGGESMHVPIIEHINSDGSVTAQQSAALTASAPYGYNVGLSFDTHAGYRICSPTTGVDSSIRVYLPSRSGRLDIESIGYEVDPGTKEARVYTYTWVNEWGEESAPYAEEIMPDETQVEVYAKQGVTVDTPAPPSGQYITKKRIYRSVATSIGATYLFVAEREAGELSYEDTVGSDVLGEVCPSIYWTPPQQALQGLVAMPNGVMAGFVGHDVYFSEPYRPFAWPETYSATVAYPIVGLAAVDTTVVVLTQGRPFFIQGSHPDSMVVVEADVSQACVSKRSIAVSDGVVFYASPDGLIGLAPNGSKNVTKGLFDRAQWQALSPETIHGYTHDGVYVGFFGHSGGGFLFDIASASFMLHGVNASTGYSDLRRDSLFVLNGTSIGKWGEGTPRTYTWRSKLFTWPRPSHLAAFRVGAEAYPVDVEVRRDGELIHSQTLTDDQPQRLPAGLGRAWDIQVVNNADTFLVEMGQSITEMTRGE